MSDRLGSMLLVSPDPAAALVLLGDAFADIDIADVATSGAGHGDILLSGGVGVEAVADVADLLSWNPGFRVVVDLLNLPSAAALEPLGRHFHDGWDRLGDLPVAVVSGRGARHFEPALIAGIAPVVDDRSAREADRLETLNAHRVGAEAAEHELRAAELDASLSAATDDLAEAKKEVVRLEQRRDRLESRLAEVDNHPALRLARFARRLERRLPGQRSGLLALAALAALALAALVVLIVLSPTVGLAVAAAVVTCGLGVTAAGVLALLWRLSRQVQQVRRQLDGSSQQVRHIQKANVDRFKRVFAKQASLARGQIDLRATQEKLVADDRQLLAAVRDVGARGSREQLANLAQVQETIRLFTSIPVGARIPPMGGWAASADLIGLLVDELVSVRPSLAVECGSGTSTLWLALAARHHGLDTRIVALEHNEEFAAATRQLLELHGVAGLAEVRVAPLAPTRLVDHDPEWYSESALEDLRDIGLLFVDGPPATTGEHARYPALPLLLDRLAPACSVILDDMIRKDEQEVAALWEPMLGGCVREDLRLQKGATVFRRT